MKSNQPDQSDLLWHYCTPETFFKIIKSQTLRFSSIMHSNDSMELQWGIDLLGKVLEGQFTSSFKSFVKESYIPWLNQFGVLAACFSKKADLLSQWRGYAFNGEGFALGFSKRRLRTYLQGYAFKDVLYFEEDQIKQLKSRVVEFEKYFLNPDSDKDDQVLYSIAQDIAAFKNTAFEEEKEFRIMIDYSTWFTSLYSGELLIRGEQLKQIVDEEVKFVMKNNIPAPYADVRVPMGFNNVLQEVMIGPKNNSSILDVKTFLYTSACERVMVSKSKASYR